MLKGQESLEPQGNALLTALLASKVSSCFLLSKSFIFLLSMDMSAVVPEMISQTWGQAQSSGIFLLSMTSRVFGFCILQAWAF